MSISSLYEYTIIVFGFVWGFLFVFFRWMGPGFFQFEDNYELSCFEHPCTKICTNMFLFLLGKRLRVEILGYGTGVCLVL